MIRSRYLPQAIYAAIVAALAGVAAALGVFARGDGTFVTVTSVRGVTYDMATTGVYAYNSRQVVAEGVGWDVFTLVVIVPAMLLLVPFVARGSLRGRLLAVGLFGYFLYQYLEYSVTWAFGPLFPLFIAIYGASLMGIVWFIALLAGDRAVDSFGDWFPRRAFAALNVTMAVLLTLMWAQRIAVGLSGDLVGAAFYGETTMVVQALDLGLMVPTALLAVFLVLRRHRAGYLFASVWIVTYVAMATAIIAMLVSAALYTGDLALPPIIIFGLFAGAAALLTARIYLHLSPGQDRKSTPAKHVAASAAAG